MTVKYLYTNVKVFWYQIFVHENLKLLDFLSDFVLIHMEMNCTTISFPARASFPLTSGRKTSALGASISGMRHSMP